MNFFYASIEDKEKLKSYVEERLAARDEGLSVMIPGDRGMNDFVLFPGCPKGRLLATLKDRNIVITFRTVELALSLGVVIHDPGAGLSNRLRKKEMPDRIAIVPLSVYKLHNLFSAFSSQAVMLESNLPPDAALLRVYSDLGFLFSSEMFSVVDVGQPIPLFEWECDIVEESEAVKALAEKNERLKAALHASLERK